MSNRSRWVLLALMLVDAPRVHGYGLPAPTLRWSSIVNPQTYTGDPRPVASVLRFSGVHWNGTDGVSIPDAGDFASNVRLSRSVGYHGAQGSDWVSMWSDPMAVAAANENYAYSASEVEGTYANTTVGVFRWWLLTGPAGPVHLRMDLLTQGHLTAGPDGASSRAHTTQVVTFIASPTAVLRERVLVMNAASLPAGDGCGGFGLIGTVPDQCFPADGAEHTLDLAIRSNPFLVQAGVPFYLGLTGGTNAAVDPLPAGAGAQSVWEMRVATSRQFPGVPGLSPDGFVVDLDGDPATPDVQSLADAGYSITTYNAPVVTDVTPTTGGSSRPVTLTVQGEGLLPGAETRLARAGDPDIIATTRTVRPDGRGLTATFDLAGHAGGAPWDLVVSNVAGDAASTSLLPGVFTITEGGAGQPWLRVIGSAAAREDGYYYFTAQIGNDGEVDMVGTVIVDGLPRWASWYVWRSPAWRDPVGEYRSDRGLALRLPPTWVPAKGKVEVPVRISVPGPADRFEIKLVWED